MTHVLAQAIALQQAREAFATQRRTQQDTFTDELLPHVEEALRRLSKGRARWSTYLLDEVEDLYERAYGDLKGSGSATFGLRKSVRNTLAKSTPISDATTIARWLAALIWTTATEQAARDDDAEVHLEWVTMHDGKVRDAHDRADGQVRKPGERYDVGGVKMLRPGDPTAPIELWINCRCSLRPVPAGEESIAASLTQGQTVFVNEEGDGIPAMPGEDPRDEVDGEPAEEEHTSTCIMAIPAADSPAHSLSMEDAHATVLFFGDLSEIGAGDIALGLIQEVTAQAAAETQPFTATVSGIEQLGDEGALVWLLDSPDLKALNELILTSRAEVTDIYDAGTEAGVTRFPDFTAHVTIGYDVPMSGDAVAELSGVEEIRFDRLAVWHRGEQTEYPLGGAMPEETDIPEGDGVQTGTAPEYLQVDDLQGTGLVPWYGVLAPEGVWSGDGRMFTDGSLLFRDLPLPLGYQRSDIGGHDGAITVADIRETWREDGKVWGSGYFLDGVPEADELVGMIAQIGKYWVSVDADEAEMELDADGERRIYTSARIARTTAVAIPAFQEAFIMLGRRPMPTEQVVPDEAPSKAPPLVPEADKVRKPEDDFRDVPQAERDDRAGDGTAMPDGSFPIANTDDLGNAIQSVGRAKDPGAAKRHIKKRARDLGAEDMIPDEWALVLTVTAAGALEFVDVSPGKTEDGPGWITDPVDTDRLRDFWVHGEGAAQIGWGVPGDFNRCRVALAQYVKPQHLNGYCANRHYDALGFWPGRAPTEQLPVAEGKFAPALSMVASADDLPVYPAEWFSDPEFEIGDGRLVLLAKEDPDDENEPDRYACPLTVTEDGRVFGHVAAWDTCHIGFDGQCIVPPHSETGYAYFMNKVAHTDKGKIRAGVITLGTGHASTRLGHRPATAHYDNTGAAVCDIAVGEDEFGIWLSGGVRAHANARAVRDLQASVISGDWRQIGTNLELVAALGVNVGGFPIPRPALAASGNEQLSLVAAGIVRRTEEKTEDEMQLLASAVVAIIEEREERARRTDALKHQHRMRRAAALRRKVGQ